MRLEGTGRALAGGRPVADAPGSVIELRAGFEGSQADARRCGQRGPNPYRQRRAGRPAQCPSVRRASFCRPGLFPLAEEIPEHEDDRRDAADHDTDFHRIHVHFNSRAGRKRRNRRLFVTTDTLESDIAALARTGDSSHPPNG